MVKGRKVALGALLGMAAALIVAAPGGAGKPKKAKRPVFKLVIGKPTMTPAQAKSGKRFAVSFKVTRSDTKAALAAAKVTASATVGGKAVRAGAASRRGKALVSLAVPPTAMGKKLTLKVTVSSGGHSARRLVSFPIKRGQPLPFVSVADATVTEGNADTAALSFTVTLSAPDVQPVSVDYATADGSAAAPADYAAANGRITFAPGTTTQTVTVQAAGELAIEGDETFGVVLSNPVTARLGDATATGTITNDDHPPRTGVYSGSTSQAGGSLSFSVSPGLETVSNLTVVSDWTCNNGEKVDNARVEFPSYYTTLAPDWSFSSAYSFSNSYYTRIEVRFSGKLSQVGNATGKAVVIWTNSYGDQPSRCTSNDVSWSAS